MPGDEPMRREPPKQNLEALSADLVRVWQSMAQNASHIAAARRTIFMAYIAEGFTEAQALELIKTV